MQMRILTAAVLAAALGGCASVGGPGGSIYYECDRGTRLKVDYFPKGAEVSVNGGRTRAMKETASASGAAYENGFGWRLHTKGSEAIWNTAVRSAPEICRQVAVPR